MPQKVTIDIVTDDPKNDEIVLYLVEEGPWENSSIESRLHNIQERIYNVVDAAVDGHILSKYPNSKIQKIRIQIDCYDPPSEQISNLTRGVAKHIELSEEYQSAIQQNKSIDSLRIVYQKCSAGSTQQTG